MENLTQHSIKIILKNQATSGAYIASPNFPNYRFCWFRDGSFTAYAMDLSGEHASAARFHDWASLAINRRAQVVQRVIKRVRADEPLKGIDFLHTRYTMDGDDATPNEWPDFQMDGFGTWLWSLGEHFNLTGNPLPESWVRAADLVADYLIALWQQPCYDCWEENADKIHPHTLAAIYGGLKAHSRLTNYDHRQTMHAIASFVQKKGVVDGHFVKFVGSSMVDASLLGLATPYRLVELDDPLMLTTISYLERSLMQGGGVHRYSADLYYGGGEWILLTGWLGWYYTEVKRYENAKRMLEWIEKQADVNGYLPEQIPLNLNNPNNYEPWVKRWGPIAKPLVWSHAKYLILSHFLSG